jgi:hypothetical protein
VRRHLQSHDPNARVLELNAGGAGRNHDEVLRPASDSASQGNHAEQDEDWPHS